MPSVCVNALNDMHIYLEGQIVHIHIVQFICSAWHYADAMHTLKCEWIFSAQIKQIHGSLSLHQNILYSRSISSQRCKMAIRDAFLLKSGHMHLKIII